MEKKKLLHHYWISVIVLQYWQITPVNFLPSPSILLAAPTPSRSQASLHSNLLMPPPALVAQRDGLPLARCFRWSWHKGWVPQGRGWFIRCIILRASSRTCWATPPPLRHPAPAPAPPPLQGKVSARHVIFHSFSFSIRPALLGHKTRVYTSTQCLPKMGERKVR